MTESTKIITYKTLSYIHYGIYFIYLRCILFLNTIDKIVFSNLLEDDDNDINKSTTNFYSNHTITRQDSYNSLNRHVDHTSFSIFDVSKKNFLNIHTQNQINFMEELLFSDY